MHTPFIFLRQFAGLLVAASFFSVAGFAADSPGGLDSTPQGWVDLPLPANLAGWTRLAIPPTNALGRAQWHLDAARQLLICDGDGGHEMLQFNRLVTNGIFHVEFRFVPVVGENVKYNSGIFVRDSADGTVWHQCQLTMDGGYLFGKTPTNGLLQRFKAPAHERRMKPAGDWNSAEVTARGTNLTVWLNGGVVSDFSGCGQPAGYLALESEGYAIEFRNLKFKALP